MKTGSLRYGPRVTPPPMLPPLPNSSPTNLPHPRRLLMDTRSVLVTDQLPLPRSPVEAADFSPTLT